MTPPAAGSMVASRPGVAIPVLERLVRDRWDVVGVLSPLPSERDQNLRVDVDGRPSFVLKVANPVEDPAFLDAQEAALARLVAAGSPVAASVVPRGGPVTLPVGGRPARVRLVRWLEGTPVADLDRHPPDLPQALGAVLGRVTAALDGYVHHGADRPFQWDVRRAMETVEIGLPAVRDAARRDLLERTLGRLRRSRPAVRALRRSVIHNDANDHNVLLDADGRISGLLDLGDMVTSATAAEPAIAAVYLVRGDADPVVVAQEVVAGFERAFRLRDDERALIPDLMLARVAISVAISAVQATLDPDPYLRISEARMWALLERLAP